MRFHPNSTYFYAHIEERRKLIFPAEWDLSEIKALCGTGHRGAVEYEGGDLDRMYGPTWFLDNVARETGLTDDLRKVFDGNMEMAQDALTLAYYLFLESRTYSHIREEAACSEDALRAYAHKRLLCQQDPRPRP